MDSSTTTTTSEPLTTTAMKNSIGSIGLTEEEKIFEDFFAKNDVIDLNELKQLTIRFSVPDRHR